ncbi:hypothetical protein N7457_002764 [Penicillium paradoxum]|uniref:uncharacterized protein n=1 Tax=Penicillium paradoxum TaxID=176176 RepID=UPI002546600E|nr:uncharacterized protein N7457_002764 [Penicillium paradoxum]KAJ5787774.1 hypothetical protein N7457_002764 [Penicillium paradoxum]
MRLFAFGSNGSGQLAIGHEDDVSTPTQCLFEQQPTTTLNNESITTIAAGGNHTLLLTTSGAIYATGCNTDGRCGPSPKANITRFRRLRLPGTTVSSFKHVSATWEGTITVASEENEDRVYVFGSSPKGELGLGSTTSAVGVCIPDFPPGGAKITALASGMAHSVAVLSNGEVYGWGAARKGQLGDGNRGVRIAYSPVRVGVGFFAERVVCGREFTVVSGCGRFVVLGDMGNRWGVLNVPGSLGLGVEGSGDGVDGSGCGGFIRRDTSIGASWHGVYVHAAHGVGEEDEDVGTGARADGRTGSDPGALLVAWGRNDRGQLPPPDLPTPVKIAVGSEHVLALLGDGRVAAFGWGEHGNCGPDTDSQGNVSGKYNVISLPETVGADEAVVGVGAGCATSWMVVT